LTCCQAVNRAGVPVVPGSTWLGTKSNFLYCGRYLGKEAIPGSDGRCGPYNGPQCPDCRGLTINGTAVTTPSVPSSSSTAATSPPSSTTQVMYSSAGDKGELFSTLSAPGATSPTSPASSTPTSSSTSHVSCSYCDQHGS
jgi:hypothetical protein